MNYFLNVIVFKQESSGDFLSIPCESRFDTHLVPSRSQAASLTVKCQEISWDVMG